MEIRINISEILWVYVGVCQISGKTNSLGLAISKAIVGIRINILDMPFVPIFSQSERL